MKEITKEIKDYLLSIGYPTQEKIYYFDVWLWLWREKKIVISSDYIDYTSSWMSTIETDEMYTEFHNKSDPEEAIIAAIDAALDYLIKNKK